MVALVLDDLVGFPAGLSPTILFICLPVPFICLPGWVLVVGFPAGLSPTSFHLSPRLGACGRVPGRLVSHFFSFVSQFFSFPNSILLGVLNALKNGRLGAGWSGRVPGRLVSHFLSCVSQFFSFVSLHLSPRLGACGRVPGWLVSHFLSFVSHFFSFVSQFFSFVSQAECLWWGFRLACLPLPCICLPLLFICLPGWVLVVGFPAPAATDLGDK